METKNQVTLSLVLNSVTGIVGSSIGDPASAVGILFIVTSSLVLTYLGAQADLRQHERLRRAHGWWHHRARKYGKPEKSRRCTGR
ncbi:MAG: hypothetical protein UY63_C0001G0055 [Parcubacteria group bacterium GW2011_GWA2_51_10]|nr:MAG: hypothetical protein UY63_C0001G0055 [Parcubacteria group bacterium GW2011_GWA2_51_10]